MLQRNLRTQELLVQTRDQAEELEAQQKSLRLAQEELQATEQFFRSVLELAPDGLMVTDQGGFIKLANAKCEELFGYTRAELVGRPVEMLVPDDVRPRHADLRAEFHRSPAARAMGSGRELQAVRKDGSLFPVEIGLSPLPAERRNLGGGERPKARFARGIERLGLRLGEDAPRLERWLAQPATDRDALLELARELLLGENQLRDVLDDLTAIAARRGSDAASVLRDATVRAVRARGLGRNEAIRALKQALRRLRYPQLSAAEQRLAERVKALRLPAGVQVELPENLEGERIGLILRARSAAELRAQADAVVAALRGATIEEMFAVLGGEW